MLARKSSLSSGVHATFEFVCSCCASEKSSLQLTESCLGCHPNVFKITPKNTRMIFRVIMTNTLQGKRCS